MAAIAMDPTPIITNRIMGVIDFNTTPENRAAITMVLSATTAVYKV